MSTTDSFPDTSYLGEADFPAGQGKVFERIDPTERERAIREAESTLELDVNGGQPIELSTSAIDGTHYSQAAALYATYVLTRSARHPQSNTRGAISDNDMDAYQDRLREDYIRKIERINATDEDDIDDEPGESSGDRTHGGFVTTVTPGSNTGSARSELSERRRY